MAAIFVDQRENGLIAFLAGSRRLQEGGYNKLRGRALAYGVALLECGFCVFEYLLAMSLVIMVWRDLLPGADLWTRAADSAQPTLADAPAVALGILRAAVSAVLPLTWIAMRYGGMFHCEGRAWGFWRALAGAGPALSAEGALVCALSIMQTAVIATVAPDAISIASWRAGEPGDEPQLDYSHVAELLVAGPIKEEVVFRAVLISILLNRAAPGAVWTGVVGPNLLFAAFHLVNLVSSQFAPFYIALQVGFGFLMGAYYALRCMETRALWESTTMHIVNNAASSVIALASPEDLDRHPILRAVLIWSVCVYLVLCLRAGMRIGKKAK